MLFAAGANRNPGSNPSSAANAAEALKLLKSYPYIEGSNWIWRQKAKKALCVEQSNGMIKGIYIEQRYYGVKERSPKR